VSRFEKKRRTLASGWRLFKGGSGLRPWIGSEQLRVAAYPRGLDNKHRRVRCSGLSALDQSIHAGTRAATRRSARSGTSTTSASRKTRAAGPNGGEKRPKAFAGFSRVKGTGPPGGAGLDV
jgi:hypothetical protein